MRFSPALLLCALGLAAAGCGDDGADGSATGERATAPPARTTDARPSACRPAPRTLAGILESTLTVADGGLANPQVVRVEDGPAAPNASFREGAYVAAARLTGPGMAGRTAVWVVSHSIVHTGGGLIFAADAATRRLSEAGAGVGPSSPVGRYVTELGASAAAADAVACARR